MPELMDSFLGKQLCRRSQRLGGQWETLVWCIFQGIILIVSNILQREWSWVMGNSARLYLQNSTNIPRAQPRSTRCQGKTLDTPAHPQLQGEVAPPGQPQMLKALLSGPGEAHRTVFLLGCGCRFHSRGALT